jgi:squalene cyclase
MEGDLTISYKDLVQKIKRIKKEALPSEIKQEVINKVHELREEIKQEVIEEFQKQGKAEISADDINRIVISVLKKEGYDIAPIEIEDIEETIEYGVEWIKKEQYEGGWGWHRASIDAPIVHKPTAWDTSKMIMALSEVEEKRDFDVIQKGIDWLKENRNSEKVWNGPWIQSSTVSDTSFAIIAFCRAGEDPSSDIIQNAVDWIKKMRHPYGGWATIPEIGNIEVEATSLAVVALLEAGEERNSEIIKDAVKWLKNNQCLDGGWGIEWVGSSERSYITRTCDAMNALLKAGESTESETIQKGMKWLLKAQDLVTEDGGWGWGYELEKIGEEVNISSKENTAVAIMALLDSDVEPTHWAIQRGIRWLMAGRDRWGRDTASIISTLYRYIKATKGE